MFQDFRVGQFIPANSIVHSLDPRTKLMVLTAAAVMVLLTESWASLILGGIFVLPAIFLTKIPVKYYFSSFKPLLPVFVFTLLVNGLNFDQGHLWLGSIKVSQFGLLLGTLTVVRLGLVILLTTAFSFTTSPIALADALEKLFKPLSKFGFPGHEISLMLTMALRFIPTIMQEGDRMVKAVQARGGSLTGGGLISTARNLAPLLIPLFVSAFRRADDLALAMEGRCYRGGKGRTRYRELVFSSRDFVTMAITGGIVIAALVG
ncbi:MAG TPA: energy-coupling factor transporter transmembrane component T, partial [Verrucomicrobiae bacterium]|nr:energy-coupling factor transporter transmembrane component T [Verrucomicrobiae bacterium]